MIWMFVFTNRMNSYENFKIQKEIKEQKLEQEILMLDPNYLNVLISKENKFYYQGKELIKPDKLIVRVGCSLNEHIKDIMYVLQTMNIKIINKIQELEIVTNKFLTANKLKNINVPYIKSLKVTGNNNYNLDFIEQSFQYPLIVKSKIGSLGKGIYKIKTKAELKNIFEQINLLDPNYEYLIQEYISQGNIDYRVVVHQGQIKYVLRRTAKAKEFKTNYNLGSEVKLDEITQEIVQLIDKVYQQIPLDIMGLDLIKVSEASYVVCEINSNPGFKGRDSISKKESFAKDLIKFIKEY